MSESISRIDAFRRREHGGLSDTDYLRLMILERRVRRAQRRLALATRALREWLEAHAYRDI